MIRLIILIIACTALAFLSQKFSVRNELGGFQKKDRLFFVVLAMLIFIFAGTRVDYNDTAAYIYAFNHSAEFPAVLNNLDWKLGNNPGFKIFTAIIRTITKDYHNYLMICSMVVFLLLLSFFRRYSVNFPLTIYFFFTAGYFLFAMAAVKQTLATAIVTLALQCYFYKKRFLYLFLLLLAATIHPYALMYLIVPILARLVPWTKSTYFLILATILTAFSFNWLVGTIVNVTDIMGEGYTEEAFIGDGVNIFRVLVYFVPVVFTLIYRRYLFEHSSKIDNVFMNGTIMSALIMFVGMFGNANMFARLAMYFDPLQLLALPWILTRIQKGSKSKVLTILAVLGYFCYFIYMTVLSKPFDSLFKYISFWDYLKNLIG